ncbi:MAG TPA: porin [Planctomycetaceae bacterium]|nr:porin [Planctomycetaceae bacterium]
MNWTTSRAWHVLIILLGFGFPSSTILFAQVPIYELAPTERELELFDLPSPETDLISGVYPAEELSHSNSLIQLPAEKPKSKPWYEKIKFRGYAQFRMNDVTHLAAGSAPPQHAGDRSVSEDQTLFLRRARITFSGDVNEHLSIYLQPDFATDVPGSRDANHFVQVRDWYGDLHLTTDKVHRIRAGQSKVPYGWENLQSSSNRLALDRNDAFNSATKNERDMGVYYYWTPEWAQELYDEVSDRGLKGSGNYGVFGIGFYAGQGGSLREQNDTVHWITRYSLPIELDNGQIMELGIQGYTGYYVVLGSPIRPLGLGAVDVTPAGTLQGGNERGILDQRLGWSFIYYPQPIGFQAEWTIGRGPELNAAQTAVERSSLYGGYVMMMYKLDDFHGTWIPFTRWQYYEGGYKNANNAPSTQINELELGVEWQFRPSMRLNVMYTFTDRTNLSAISSSAPVSSASYGQFDGQILRSQFQISY